MSEDEEIKEKDTMRKAKIIAHIIDVIAVSMVLYAQVVDSLIIATIACVLAFGVVAGYIFLYNRRRQSK
jgi:hypothetical protein